MTFLEAMELVEREFPDENDPGRYECLALVLQLFVYRQIRHAERLRAMATAEVGKP